MQVTSDNRVNRKTIDGQIDRIKANIKDFREYFDGNYQRYNRFMKFVFETSLSADDRNTLSALGKPQIEFNILEAYISRRCGEFAGQEPTLQVRPSYDASKIDPQLMEIIESHVRAIIFDANNTGNIQYELFREILAGGFSVLKVHTDYLNPKSMHQGIFLKKVFDPTLCGFDKFARESHKGDGDYCFELYPMKRTEFESEHGTKYTERMNFTRDIDGYGWSYKNDSGEEFVLVGDYYEKKKKKTKIIELLDGTVLEERHYDNFLEHWNSSMTTQAPVVVGRPRQTVFETICRYVITENDVIEYTETDWTYLPLVFFDGNSVLIKDFSGKCAQQMTRPMVYHAEGIQKLKNFSGITLANEIENMVQSKFSISKEAIPPDYLDAYLTPQKFSTMVYNGFYQDNPDIPLQGPQVIPRVPSPPEVMATFTVSDEVTQAILGTYDAALGINNNELSGRAIDSGAVQSNAATKPYEVGYTRSWNQVGKIILDLIPKYMTKPRQIPVQGLDKKRSYVRVNDVNTPQLDQIESHNLEITISTGVNFEIQRARAFEMLMKLMSTVPMVGQYITTTPQGMEMLLDNLDIRGIDALKEGVAAFTEQEKQKQEQAQQMAMQQQQIQMKMMEQNNPMLIEKAKLQLSAQESQIEAAQEQERIDIEREKANTDRIVAIAKLGNEQDKNIIAAEKTLAQNMRTAADLEISHADKSHGHAMDLLKIHVDNSNRKSDIELKSGKLTGE